jgi:hypothetical protein
MKELAKLTTTKNNKKATKAKNFFEFKCIHIPFLKVADSAKIKGINLEIFRVSAGTSPIQSSYYLKVS